MTAQSTPDIIIQKPLSLLLNKRLKTMSSDSHHHHNQQLLHNRYEYDYHLHNNSGYLDNRVEHAHSVVECHHHHQDEMERQGAAGPGDAIIRGNSK